MNLPASWKVRHITQHVTDTMERQQLLYMSGTNAYIYIGRNPGRVSCVPCREKVYRVSRGNFPPKDSKTKKQNKKSRQKAGLHCATVQRVEPVLACSVTVLQCWLARTECVKHAVLCSEAKRRARRRHPGRSGRSRRREAGLPTQSSSVFESCTLEGANSIGCTYSDTHISTCIWYWVVLILMANALLRR